MTKLIILILARQNLDKKLEITTALPSEAQTNLTKERRYFELFVEILKRTAKKAQK